MIIVQIGCNNCDDHVKDFVAKNCKPQDTLVLVDPNETRIQNCHKIYQNYSDLQVHIIPKAITTTNDATLVLYLNKKETNGHHTSFNKKHLVAHNHPLNEIEECVFPSININKLFDEYNITTVDRLYVDTEGYDIDILRSIDHSKYTIKFIQFESVHSDGPFSHITEKLINYCDHLKALGYSFPPAPQGEVIAVLRDIT